MAIPDDLWSELGAGTLRPRALAGLTWNASMTGPTGSSTTCRLACTRLVEESHERWSGSRPISRPIRAWGADGVRQRRRIRPRGGVRRPARRAGRPGRVRRHRRGPGTALEQDLRDGAPRSSSRSATYATSPALQAAIARAAERLGPIRVLVNNAANDRRDKVAEMDRAVGRPHRRQRPPSLLRRPGRGGDDAGRRGRLDHQPRIDQRAHRPDGPAGLHHGEGRRRRA